MAAKKTPPAAEPGDPQSFEQALERLETVVEELEGGSLTLEASIARYEEGVRLSRQLSRTLDQAEQRIERLVAADGGEPSTEPMELGDDAPAPDAPAPDAPAPAASRGTTSPRGGTGELPF